MYKNLWSNGYKEVAEFPDYTFDEHFGQPTPTFAPRAVLKDYLEGRMIRKSDKDLKNFIEFSTVVRWIKFDDLTKKYTVTVNNLKMGETREEMFTHIVVAVGIYNTPFILDIPGMDKFNGRLFHSHDFRDATEFKGQKVLLIGSGYSGEDIALQLMKFGATKISLSYKSVPKNATCIMPQEIEEKPLVIKLDAKKAYFIDGTKEEFDSVILCTGYRNYFPFLESRFRIPEETHFYPPGLYMGALFFKEGNNTLFYVGVQILFYSFTYFEALAVWTCRYIMGNLKGEPKTLKEMEDDSNIWMKRAESIKSETEGLHFQTDHIDTLVEKSEYEYPLTKVKTLMHEWIKVRKEGLGLTRYRDHVVKSPFTGFKGLKQKPFMENFDDSLEAFLNVASSDDISIA
ncbi:hypothetical protein ACF0H5_022324 [Mactra antiquata]